MSDSLGRLVSVVDRHVGRRICMRRLLLGTTQEALGEALGVTFQQVQKYERGINRIGAGRLWRIARTLGVPVTYFFDDMPDDADDRMVAPGEESGEAAPTDEALAIRLMQAFRHVSDRRQRQSLVRLTETLATGNGRALGVAQTGAARPPWPEEIRA